MQFHFPTRLRLGLFGVTALLLPAVARAHQENDAAGFLAGMAHPVYGVDHLLAMICVGVVSSQLGGRNVWVIPVTFVSAMVAGGVAGMLQMGLPLGELGIALSVVMLGCCIVVAKPGMKPLLINLFVMFFGVFHGHAHGVEMPNSASPVFYTFGFLVSTSLLHLFGVGLGELTAKREWLLRGMRVAGAGVAAVGTSILLNHVGILS